MMVGAMLAKAIGQSCGVEVQLKWPNDLYFGERKLGGVLIELLGECRGCQAVVIGMGLNVAMPSPIATAAGLLDMSCSPSPRRARSATRWTLSCAIVTLWELAIA